jgi:hypothetical protein
VHLQPVPAILRVREKQQVEGQRAGDERRQDDADEYDEVEGEPEVLEVKIIGRYLLQDDRHEDDDGGAEANTEGIYMKRFVHHRKNVRIITPEYTNAYSSSLLSFKNSV